MALRDVLLLLCTLVVSGSAQRSSPETLQEKILNVDGKDYETTGRLRPPLPPGEGGSYGEEIGTKEAVDGDTYGETDTRLSEGLLSIFQGGQPYGFGSAPPSYYQNIYLGYPGSFGPYGSPYLGGASPYPFYGGANPYSFFRGGFHTRNVNSFYGLVHPGGVPLPPPVLGPSSPFGPGLPFFDDQEGATTPQ